MARRNVTIEGARILFRDFSGEKNRYNNDRTFCVVLEPELAEALINDGWPVKWLEPRNEEETRTPYLRVKVQFRKHEQFERQSPQIVLISNGTKKELNEESVNILDWVNIENVDLQIRPYNYEINGKTGIKPYLNSLWITVREDTLETKYKDLPFATDNDMLAKAVSDDEELPFN